MSATELAAQRYAFIQRVMALPDTEFQLIAQVLDGLLTGEDTLLEQLELRRLYDNQEQSRRIDKLISIFEKKIGQD